MKELTKIGVNILIVVAVVIIWHFILAGAALPFSMRYF